MCNAKLQVTVKVYVTMKLQVKIQVTMKLGGDLV